MQLLFVLGSSVNKNHREVYGYVNGMPFYKEEYLLYEERYRAVTAGMISQKYGVSSGEKGFWEMEFDGVTPCEILRSRVLEELIRDKVIQQEAAKRGIAAPADFRELKKSMEGRQGAYGPEVRSAMEQNRYLTDLAEDDLKGILLKTELVPGTGDLERAFESLPSEIKQKDFAVSGFCFRWMGADKRPGEKMTEVLEQGGNPEDIYLKLTEACPEVEMEEFLLDSGEIHREDVDRIYLSGLLFPLSQGETLLIDGDGIFSLYWISKKEGGGYLTYEEAPKLGENKWINDQFGRYVEQKVEEAEIRLMLP